MLKDLLIDIGFKIENHEIKVEETEYYSFYEMYLFRYGKYWVGTHQFDVKYQIIFYQENGNVQSDILRKAVYLTNRDTVQKELLFNISINNIKNVFKTVFPLEFRSIERNNQIGEILC